MICGQYAEFSIILIHLNIEMEIKKKDFLIYTTQHGNEKKNLIIKLRLFV